MLAEERHQKIIALIQRDGRVRIEDLQQVLSVTTETIRRDLNYLDRTKVLKKVHGGAVLSTHTLKESSFRVRYLENYEQKKIIADLASQFIKENETIMLDASSTSFCLAERIEKFERIMVISNSLKVLDALSHSQAKIIGLGGELDNSAYAFLGSQTLAQLDNLYADCSFISCHGLDLRLGIMDISPEEAAIKEKIMSHSNKHYLLINDTKFGKKGAVRIKGLEKIDYFISNTKPPSEWTEFFENHRGTLLYPNKTNN